MNTFLAPKHLAGIAVLLLAIGSMPTAMAQDIYKCVKNGQVAYTDRPCPGASGELIHKADDAEVIDQYLRLGHDNLAKQYADGRHLEALYQERLAAHQQTLKEKADLQAREQVAAQQLEQQKQQQKIADAAASRERLRNENDALRQKNDEYRDQLAKPTYNEAPTYWNSAPGYGYGGYPDRNHYDPHRPHHSHPKPRAPIYHPCQQLAGGRVKC